MMALNFLLLVLLPALISAWNIPSFKSSYPILYLFQLMPSPLPRTLLGNSALQNICQIENLYLNSTNSTIPIIAPIEGNIHTVTNKGNLSAAALFKDIVIGHSWATINWSQAEQLLDELSVCDAALENAKTFEMTFWTHRKYKHRKYQWSDLLEKSDALPPMFPAKLAAFLSSMPNIEELKLNIPIDSSPLFGRAFSDALLTLQRVKKLNIGEEGLFAISHCPNLEEIAMSGFVSPGETINAASNLKHLKRIELSGDLWNVTHSNNIVDRFPHLEHLGFLRRMYHGLEAQLPILAKLKSLKSLRLPDAASVGVGDFDGGPWCGNAYEKADGSLDEEYILEISNEWKEAERNVATITGKAFGPELQELQVGRVWFSFERDAAGGFVDVVRRAVENGD